MHGEQPCFDPACGMQRMQRYVRELGASSVKENNNVNFKIELELCAKVAHSHCQTTKNQATKFVGFVTGCILNQNVLGSAQSSYLRLISTDQILWTMATTASS
jgi:hypothetical protein